LKGLRESGSFWFTCKASQPADKKVKILLKNCAAKTSAKIWKNVNVRQLGKEPRRKEADQMRNRQKDLG